MYLSVCQKDKEKDSQGNKHTDIGRGPFAITITAKDEMRTTSVAEPLTISIRNRENAAMAPQSRNPEKPWFRKEYITPHSTSGNKRKRWTATENMR